MTKFGQCRQIVRTIPSPHTTLDGDLYVCADGSVWKRVHTLLDTMTSTVPPQVAYLHGNQLCDHQ